MFDLDKWQEILSTMRKNKLRTFLTAFGVAWGIFMLVVLLGAGKGMQNGVMKDFGSQAKNAIWLWEGKTSMPYNGLKPGRLIKYTNEDMAALRREIPEIDMLAPRNRLFGEYTLNYKSKNGAYQVFGSTGEFFKMNGEEFSEGRPLNESDIKEKRKVVVMGKKVKDVLFGKDKSGIGEYISIRGIFFQVVGIFRTDINQGRNEERAYVPFSTFQTTYNQPNQVQLMALNVKGDVSAKKVEAAVKKVLAERHKFSPEDAQAIGINNSEEDFKQIMGLFAGIRWFVVFVGLGTLMAGIVGVSNIMLIIVKERTKEIGVRKAIGATPFSIVSLILQESIVITSISGYLGLVAGVGLLDLMRYGIEKSGAKLPYFDHPEVDLEVAVAAIVVLVVAGALAGLFPAMRAANIKPIEALRAD